MRQELSEYYLKKIANELARPQIRKLKYAHNGDCTVRNIRLDLDLISRGLFYPPTLWRPSPFLDRLFYGGTTQAKTTLSSAGRQVVEWMDDNGF